MFLLVNLLAIIIQHFRCRLCLQVELVADRKAFYSRKKNIVIMNTEEKIGILAIFLLVAGSLMIPGLSQTTQTGPMNASIRQMISISISGNLTAGILFTNDTTNGTLVNITQMSAWNGAMWNFDNGYVNGGVNTSYWVLNTGSTTNITLC